MSRYFSIFMLLVALQSCKKEQEQPLPPASSGSLYYEDLTDIRQLDINSDGETDVEVYNQPETTYFAGDTIYHTSLRIRSLNDSLRLSVNGPLYELTYDEIVDENLFWHTNFRLESYVPFQPDHENAPYVGLEFRDDGKVYYGWISKPLSNNFFTEFAIDRFYYSEGDVKTGKIVKE